MKLQLTTLFVLIFSATLLMSQNSLANAEAYEMSEMAPEEIAEELGLPEAAEEMIGPMSVESISRSQNIDIPKHWPVVIWINKAARGQTAQRMRVFHRGLPIVDTNISTGREKWENAKSGRRYFSSTPTGWFNPTKLVKDYYSNTWKTDMPYAIFFNGGIALHATTKSHYKELGQRASGGCVRQTYEQAQWLFNLVKSEPPSMVPIFKRDGTIAKDANGNPYKTSGPSTLIIVEDQP